MAEALKDLGARLAPPGAEPLDVPLDGASVGQFVSACFVTDAGDVDVVMWPDGIERGYRGMVGNAVIVELHGHEVRIAALDNVIASKRRGRPGEGCRGAALPRTPPRAARAPRRVAR
ncbi:MAG: hypothetical protein KY469_20290 [Actinobacteria bacterium]|nr:hypothetical protein [Actinomycetota bacterium]